MLSVIVRSKTCIFTELNINGINMLADLYNAIRIFQLVTIRNIEKINHSYF
jgi:hypothetical protein